MSNILFIGNGFDLGLGLKTSYKDFINSEEFKGISTKDNFLSSYLTQRYNIQNWIDVEVELKKYSKQLIKNLKSSIGGSYDDQETLNQDLNYKFKLEYRELVKALDDYLSRVVQNSSLNINSEIQGLFDIFKSLHELDIVNFNYTETFQEAMQMLQFNKPKFKVNNIHNTLGNNINFGVEDINQDINESHFFILKSVNDTYGESKLQSRLLKDYRSFFFFGYSLGETDFNYFHKLFHAAAESEISRRFVLFYYDGSADDPNGQNAKDIINENLKKLLGNKFSDFKNFNVFNLLGTSALKNPRNNLSLNLT